MRYCPDCGTGHECDAGTARSAVDREVEVARIQADRDVTIARLQSRADRAALDSAETIAETEAEAEVVSAVAAAEIIAGEEEPAETGEPIVVEMPEPEPAPEPEPEMVPPAAEHHEHHEPKRAGYWDAYR